MPAPAAYRPRVVGSGDDIRGNRQGDQQRQEFGRSDVEKVGLERDIVLRSRISFYRLFFRLFLAVD